MAEEAPDRSSAVADGGNFFTRKVGPLPVWGWALAGVAVFFVVRRIGQASGSTPGPAQTPAGGLSGVNANGYSAGQTTGLEGAPMDSFLQQLQGQLASIQSAVGVPGSGSVPASGLSPVSATPGTVPGSTNGAPAPVDWSQFGPYGNQIAAAYQQILGRTPDLGGLAYWEMQAEQQGSALPEIVAISQSPEATRRTAGLNRRPQ